MVTGFWLTGGFLLYYAVLAGLERAFFRVNRLQVALRVSQKKWWARIVNKLLAQPSQFFLAARLGKMISLGGMALGVWLIGYLWYLEGGRTWHLVALAFMALFSVLLLGEVLVRWGFQNSPNALFMAFSWAAYPLFAIVFPLRWWSRRIEKRLHAETNPLSGETHVLPYPPLATGRLRKEDFLENELLENTELDTEVFSKALQLNEVRVRDFMVPRTEIIALPGSSTLEELHAKFLESEVSRIVVYGDNLDEIQGYVRSLDLLKGSTNITEMLQPVMLVPETMSASSLLGEINQQHRSLAIVLDEYGGTAGLVTIEDLVEIVFGEIEDEYDEPDTDPLTEKEVAPGVYHLAGRLEVEYLNRKYKFQLPMGTYSTLAGLVLHLAEHIPKTGEVFRCGGWQLTVLQASPRKVELVKLEKRR